MSDSRVLVDRLAVLFEDFGPQCGLTPGEIEDKREDSLVVIVDGWAWRVTLELLGDVEDDEEDEDE